MARQVLITGATGFLGGVAARDMRQAGWTVVTTGRDPVVGAKLKGEGFDFVSLDLSDDPDALRKMAKDCEAVVHCAALSSPWGRKSEFVACNVTATQNVLAACREVGARLVHVSSPSVSFGFFHQRNLREDTPWPEPAANHYIATKRQAEQLVRDAVDVSSIILRPKALIGPGDTTLLPRVLRAARRGRFPQFSDGDPLLDLTTASDVAAGLRLAAEAPESCLGKTYHLTGGQPLSASEAFNLLFESCGLNVRNIPITTRRALILSGALEKLSQAFTGGLWEPPLTRYTVGSLAFEQTLDISAARRELGYSPTGNIREALRECGRHWRKQNEYPSST